MAYRGPGQNGTPYGNNRPYNPANSSFNPSAPPFKPLNSPNPVRNPLSTSARGRGQEAQTPRGGYRGRGGRGNLPFRGPTRNPQMPPHNVYSLNFAVEAEKDTGGPNDSGEDTNDESNGSLEGNLMEMGIPLSPRKSQDFHRVNMISRHNPRISQVQEPQPTPSMRRQNQRRSNGNQPMPARDHEAPGTSRMDDRSQSEATNHWTRDSMRFRPWMVEPSAPEVTQGCTGRGSPSQQFEDFQRRYEEWDLNVLEAQVGRKNEYPAPVLRPIRWNSSAPNDQRQSENWGKITAYRCPDFSAADSGPSFGFTGTDEPLWDSYTQFLVVKKDFMDHEIPAFLPRAQAKSYCRYRKQQMRAFDADQEQRRAEATRVYDANERQCMEDRAARPRPAYVPRDDASRFVAYEERGLFADIPTFVTPGLEKQYSDFRNRALHGFDEDQLQRRQRALWIFDEDERTMKARTERTDANRRAGLPPIPEPNDLPQSLYERPFSCFETVGYGIVERPRETPPGRPMLSRQVDRENMRAAIGFWTWLGREDGLLRMNEQNSHVPPSRHTREVGNPWANRTDQLPPLEENSELDPAQNNPRAITSPCESDLNPPTPSENAEERDEPPLPEEEIGTTHETTDRPDEPPPPSSVPEQRGERLPSPENLHDAQEGPRARRRRYRDYWEECLQGERPQNQNRGPKKAGPKPRKAKEDGQTEKGPRAQGRDEPNPPRGTRARRW